MDKVNIGCVLFHNVNELEVVLVHSLLERAVSCANAIDSALEPTPRDAAATTQEATHAATSEHLLPVHQVFTVAKSRHSVQTASGLTLTPTWAFMGAPPLDVLIVPSGVGLPLRDKDKQLFSYLEQKSQQAKVVVGLGSGVSVLGECGLLCGLVVSAPGHLHDYLEQYEILGVNTDTLTVGQLERNNHPILSVWSGRGGLSTQQLTAELIATLFGDYIQTTVMSKIS
jgi:transcriptional regulator GlxA family with amidase domain